VTGYKDILTTVASERRSAELRKRTCIQAEFEIKDTEEEGGEYEILSRRRASGVKKVFYSPDHKSSHHPYFLKLKSYFSLSYIFFPPN